MFPRLVYESFRRQTRRKLLAGVAITLGVAVATAMIAVATDIGDKINRELRSYGANLVVTPQEDTLDVEIGGVNLKPPSDGAFLSEADLPKIRGTFWHHNIVGFSPMLPVTVKVGSGSAAKNVTLVGTYFNKPLNFGKEDFTTGVEITHPWWKVSWGTGLARPGRVEASSTACGWPDDNSQNVLVGERLAAKLGKKPGDTIEIAGRQLSYLRHPFHRRGRRRPDRRAARPRAADSWQTRRRAPRLRQRSDQATGCACRPRSQNDDARGLRPLVLLALRAVDCLPVTGSHSAFARRADSPGRAERRHRALTHQGTDAADYVGRAFRLRARCFRRHGHGDL